MSEYDQEYYDFHCAHCSFKTGRKLRKDAADEFEAHLKDVHGITI